MNNLTSEFMTLFFVLLCCLCTFLIIISALSLYILGSKKLRQALLAISLIKTAVDFIKDVRNSLKSTRNSASSKPTSNTQVIDAEFRDKNK